MFKGPGYKQNDNTSGLIYSQVLRLWGQTRQNVKTYGVQRVVPPNQVSSGKQLCPESVRTGGFNLAENANHGKQWFFSVEKLTDPPQGHSLGDSGQSVSGGSAAGAADGTVLCPQSRHVGCTSFHRGHVIRNEACIRVVPEQYFYHHDVCGSNSGVVLCFTMISLTSRRLVANKAGVVVDLHELKYRSYYCLLTQGKGRNLPMKS